MNLTTAVVNNDEPDNGEVTMARDVDEDDGDDNERGLTKSTVRDDDTDKPSEGNKPDRML
jgi:hypothetical protein